MVKVGSIWSSPDKKFRVISVAEVDGHMWIHYREDLGVKVSAKDCKEYSCYEESFLLRFRPLPE
jgi:hypothetical protein